MGSSGDDFYLSVPAIADFGEALKPEAHQPLPDDWVVGFADVVGSTQALADGRYKAVNMIGAGVIAAVSNAVGRQPFPFVFGGDGASFAVPGAFGATAAQALQAMAGYAEDEAGLQLRVATAPVATIRASGGDVRITRYEASPDCVYAMFSGGGLSWFETEAKSGRFLLPRAAAGVRPDLSGLSCRWGLAPAKHGLILSVIVAPRGEDSRYAALLADIVRFVASAEDSGRPVTMEALQPGPATEAIAYEGLSLFSKGGARWLAKAKAALLYGVGYLAFRTKLKAGDFDMKVYMESITTNADFRKFDDGLRMTLDCSPAFADELERRLAASAGFARYGTFRQSNALLTCFVPTTEALGGTKPVAPGDSMRHIHFVDGAGGGYTMAAKAMKARALEGAATL